MCLTKTEKQLELVVVFGIQSIIPLIIKNKKDMEDLNFKKGDAKTAIFGSEAMLQSAPVDRIPDGPTTPEIAYQMVKDETFAQTQPRLNLATFVTTYMDD